MKIAIYISSESEPCDILTTILFEKDVLETLYSMTLITEQAIPDGEKKVSKPKAKVSREDVNKWMKAAKNIHSDNVYGIDINITYTHYNILTL